MGIGSRAMALHRYLFLILLAACSPAEPAIEHEPDTVVGVVPGLVPPMPETATMPPAAITIEVAAPDVEEIIEAAPEAVEEDLVCPAARNLIIQFEVSSRVRYERLYLRPICPLCRSTRSGVTIGIGSDLGHMREAQIQSDWERHPQVLELLQAAGIKGVDAIQVTARMQHVTTPYLLAEQVFDETVIPIYYRIAHRAFGDGFLVASPCVRGVLVSLVINRGGSLTGESRREMRAIGSQCMQPVNVACIAGQIRSMKRLWSDAGLINRRELEARFLEQI